MCAQVSKIYMKTELQCVPSRPCRDAKYFIFHLPASLRLTDLEGFRGGGGGVAVTPL